MAAFGTSRRFFRFWDDDTIEHFEELMATDSHTYFQTSNFVLTYKVYMLYSMLLRSFKQLDVKSSSPFKSHGWAASKARLATLPLLSTWSGFHRRHTSVKSLDIAQPSYPCDQTHPYLVTSDKKMELKESLCRQLDSVVTWPWLIDQIVPHWILLWKPKNIVARNPHVCIR